MARSTADTVRKTRLAVKCKSIVETEISFDKTDKFFESGTFGKVRHGYWGNQEVAVKYFSSAEEKKGYKEELVFLSKLQTHDHIVVLFGTGVSKSSNQPFIVLEFAPYSLEHVLHRSYPHYCYDAGHVMHWCRQLALGLEYIHKKRILHRDIKASNVLLFGNGCHLKLCDFGTCRKLESNLLYTASIGTVRYMAPEVIKGEQYTAKCDIFSLAITFWEMLARQLPTVEPDTYLNSYAILFKMVEGKRPPLLKGVPRFIIEVLTRCWHQDPQERLTSSEILQKLTSVCKFFDYGAPLTIMEQGEYEQVEKSLSEVGTCSNFSTEEGLSSVCSEPEELLERKQPVAPSVLERQQPVASLVLEGNGVSPIHRSQSDVSNMTESKPLKYFDVQRSMPLSQSPLPEEQYPHGYPPREYYPSGRMNLPLSDDGQKTSFLSSPGGGQYALIDHDVNEISEPHSNDKRYASLDENRMRFDVQRQFHHIQQAYSPRSVTLSVSSSYTPALKSRLMQPTKATTGSPYSIAGLPPDMQPVLPVVEDPESLKLWEQYKQLAEQVQTSKSS